MEKDQTKDHRKDDLIQFTVNAAPKEMSRAEVIAFLAEFGFVLWTMDEKPDQKRNIAS